MKKALSYQGYVSDKNLMEYYRQYQERYSHQMRESDKILLQWIQDIAATAGQEPLKLLDVGCASGMLLLHIKNHMPAMKLAGIDMATEILAHCRQDARLAGIDFEVRDAIALQADSQFDIVTVNAVFFSLDDTAFAQAVQGISRALKPGGWLLSFDMFHPFEQEVVIYEKTKLHPLGLMMYFRPYNAVLDVLTRAAFESVIFSPFSIPLDLPKPEYTSTVTHTQRLENGERLQFRGVLHQPWCHLKAQKKG